MTLLGLWLLVVGACDLLRAARDATTLSRRLLIGVIGSLLLLAAGLVTGLSTAGWLLVWLPAGAAFWAWVLGSAAALGAPEVRGRAPDGPAGSVTSRAVALAGLAVGVLVPLLGGGARSADVAWPGALADSALARWPVDEVLLVTAVGIVQISTVNVMVRLVLDAVGVPANANEKQLKGGRVLGPLERFFIVGLGLAGQVTAASVVVAAKGLLRFPELQRGADDPGPSDVTEYFLIGSFTSWLAALAGVALVLMA